MELPIDCSILIGILSLGFLLYAAGIYCCYREKNKLKKQKIILINLSVVEIIQIIFMIAHLFLDHVPFHLQDMKEANRILCTIYHGITNLFYSTMISIPLDRLICVVSPAFYYCIVRMSTVKKTVILIWTFSLVSVIPFPFITDLKTHMKIILYYCYGVQAIFFTISATTYTLVARSQLRRSSLFVDSTRRASEISRNGRTLSVSVALNLTFILFYVVPNYMPTPANHGMYLLLCGISYVGLMVDPIVYTLMHKDLRPFVVSLFTCKGRLTCTNDEVEEVVPLQKISLVVTPCADNVVGPPSGSGLAPWMERSMQGDTIEDRRNSEAAHIQMIQDLSFIQEEETTETESSGTHLLRVPSNLHIFQKSRGRSVLRHSGLHPIQMAPGDLEHTFTTGV